MKTMNTAYIQLTLSPLLIFLFAACAENAPLKYEYKDERLVLNTQSGRDIPLRVLTPEECKTCPLIIFSHGANAANDRYDALTLPFAEAGYRVVVPNHTDSELHPNRESYTASDWMPTRLEDYKVIAAHFKTDYLISAGHSFGALIAQISGGAQVSPKFKVTEAYRPDAVLAYSPPGPVFNYIAAKTWNTITVPSLVTTGTTDIVPMMAEQWQLHLTSYNQAPPNLAYALIYKNMDHYMNGAYGRELQTDTVARKKSMEHLIDSSLFFLHNIRENRTVTAEQWETRKQSFVDVKSNHD